MAGGYKSYTGLWEGGAAAPGVSVPAGYISFTAFWTGGAAASVTATPPRKRGPVIHPRKTKEQIVDDDENVIKLVVVAIREYF